MRYALLALLLLVSQAASATAPIRQMAMAEEPSQAALIDIWQTNLKQYGDTPRAREKTVADIKQLSQVVDAGLSRERTGIWVRFKSGAIAAFVLTR